MKLKMFKKDRRYLFNYSKFEQLIGKNKELEKMDGKEIRVVGKFAGTLLYHNSNTKTDVYRHVTPSMCDEYGKILHI